MEKKVIAIMGLGLIGGSLAAALRGFEDYEIVGIARRRETADYAMEHGVCDRVSLDPREILPQADLTFLCMDPEGIIRILQEDGGLFAPGSLVSDVCGIKGAIMKAAEALPPEVDFIGSHPMAGTEFSGVEHSFPEMFRNAHYLMTPRPTSTGAHIDLIRRLADYAGFRDVVTTTPEAHDSMIAYTSQMMHIIAVSVSDDESLFTCRGFEGNSFRDCTRVAALDAGLWTQLFSNNSEALCACLDRLMDNLDKYREVLRSGDKRRLKAMLEYSSARKKLVNLDIGLSQG